MSSSLHWGSPLAKLTNRSALHKPRTSQTWCYYPSRPPQDRRVRPTGFSRPSLITLCLTDYFSLRASSSLLWMSSALISPPLCLTHSHSECFSFWHNRLITLSHNLAQPAGVRVSLEQWGEDTQSLLFFFFLPSSITFLDPIWRLVGHVCVCQ